MKPLKPTQNKSEPSKRCEICNANEAIYCCPQCFIRTCSLKCVKSHKTQTKCQGRRDRTKFLPLARMTDTTLKSDYHLLEDVLTKSEKGKRLIQDLGVKLGGVKKRKLEEKRSLVNDNMNDDETLPLQPLLQLKLSDEKKREKQSLPMIGEKRELEEELIESKTKQHDIKQTTPLSMGVTSERDAYLAQFPYKKQQLVHQARKRNTNLLLMAPILQRHKLNRTRYDVKKDIFYWKVEFRLHSRSGLKIGNPDQVSPKILIVNFASEQKTLQTYLESVLEANSSHSAGSMRSYLKPFCRHGHSDQLKDGISVLLKRLPCPSSRPKYVRVNVRETLNLILKDKTVIEHPSFEIVHAEDMSQFPLFIEELNCN